jgi:hypothetical protein
MPPPPHTAGAGRLEALLLSTTWTDHRTLRFNYLINIAIVFTIVCFHLPSFLKKPLEDDGEGGSRETPKIEGRVERMCKSYTNKSYRQ